MSVLLIIVELDVDFERADVAFWVLNEKLLLPLDKNWDAILSENVQEDMVLLTDQVGH